MAYLYPNLPSKAAYRRAIADGAIVTARDKTPWGDAPVEDGQVAFEGPHAPETHRFYGKATVKDGMVVKIQ